LCSNNYLFYLCKKYHIVFNLYNCFFLQINCQYVELCGADYEINNLNNQSGLSDLWTRTINDNENQNKFNHVYMTLKSKDIEQKEQV